jgi:hypothetical protein
MWRVSSLCRVDDTICSCYKTNTSAWCRDAGLRGCHCARLRLLYIQFRALPRAKCCMKLSSLFFWIVLRRRRNRLAVDGAKSVKAVAGTFKRECEHLQKIPLRWRKCNSKGLHCTRKSQLILPQIWTMNFIRWSEEIAIQLHYARNLAFLTF